MTRHDPQTAAANRDGIRQRRPRWPRRLLAGYWLGLLVATHYPKVPGIEVPGKDRTLHFVAYAILTWLLLAVMARRLRRGALALAGASLLIVAAYGALDELTQPYTGRTADLVDWLFDVAGALATIGVYLATVRRLVPEGQDRR